MKIFPAIDIRGGKCVRLLQGKADAETRYYDDPVVPATYWKEAGAAWIHVVDLDGAFTGKPQNLETLKRITALGVPVQFGGGMRSIESVQSAIDAGASRVVVGTMACQDEDFAKELAKQFGSKVAVGIDAKNGKVAVKGWVNVTSTKALDLAEKVTKAGIQTIIYTDIATDGMMTGPNLEAQAEMCEAVKANIVASGGVSKPEDICALADLARRLLNLEGVIIGKALYEKTVDLAEAITTARRP